MEIVLPRVWREEFERAAAVARDDAAYKDRMLRYTAADRERRDRDEELTRENEEREERLMMDAELATAEEIGSFTVELDRYDTTTVEALMDNQDALDAVTQRLDLMLEQAEVLPGGRRVFKTRDGQHVFDEHGQEVPHETIDPHVIDDKRPKWESFKSGTDEYGRLVEERKELTQYQVKLDDARERLNKGEISEGDLKKIKKGLQAGMPEAVRQKLGLDKPGPDAGHEIKGDAPVLSNDMDALMQKTGFTSQISPSSF